MKKRWLVVLACCLILAGLYVTWYFTGRDIPGGEPKDYPTDISTYGKDTNRGNLLAIQPYMIPADYATQRSFYHKIDRYLALAKQKGWLNKKTIAVLPEYIGAWLVTAGEKRNVYEAKKIVDAMTTIVLSDLLSFVLELPFTGAQDGVKYSIFKIKAQKAAKIYHRVFSRLAKKYHVTLVAGSIILPAPEIKRGRLVIGNGNLQNVSVVYQPNGKPYPALVRKTYPIQEELAFLNILEDNDLPVFETPAGRLGVLVCADAWYPTPYTGLKPKKVDIIAVVSFLAAENGMENPWHGYNKGAPIPEDVDLTDVEKIKEKDAWVKYALAGRIKTSGARYGVNVFLLGELWDLGSDGSTVIVNQGQVIEAKNVKGSAVVNFWLPK